MNRAAFRGILSGAVGFVVYGGWAYFVNSAHGQTIGLVSALVQGSYSFVLTLSTTWMMEIIYSLLVRAIERGAAVMTIGITISLLFLTAYSINWIAGTPEILMTILPGFVIGSGYTIGYVLVFLVKRVE